MAKRKSRKGSRYDQWIAAGIVITLAAIALYLWGPLHTFKGAREEKRQPEIKKLVLPPKRKLARERRGAEKHKPAATEKAAVIAVVIDDLGQDLAPARELLALPYKITLAVMPGLPQSKKITELAKQSDREVLLHLPMEPKNRNGKREAFGTLRSDMTPMEFMAAISTDVDSVPGAAGVNNHEGSALTENSEAMKFLMAELKARGLFFLDSLTNPKSIAFSTAKEFGLKAAKRDVFIDNESNSPASIRGQLDELARIAKKRGSAIGIGHPHPATMGELKKWLATLDEQGIEIVPVSRLVK
jgi:polysaccharide deacetylase 2 family uncharacterized protein YibQ